MRIFPGHSLLVDEFEKVKQLALEECAGTPGQVLVQSIQPSDDFFEVMKSLEQTEECRKVFSAGEPLPTEAYPDTTADLKLLGIRNSVLAAPQFMTLAKITDRARLYFEFFKTRAERLPLLYSVIHETVYEPSILESIDRVMDETGVVRNTASPELARIRKQLARKRLEAEQLYQQVIQKYRKNGWLTDAEESFRGGRRVVSVFAEQKRSVKGIVHDLSSTGKTCFVEPEEAIGINNLILSLEEEERAEIQRILKELTEHLRRHHGLLSKYAANTATFDAIAAKARLALRLNAHLPFIENKPRVDLRDARHPLLSYYNTQQGKPTIPFTLQLDGESRILVISGPNAGGKSVCMKTTGLLQMMLQSGFLITADGNSKCGFFKSLLVDIGDSQSLEFELSTYSSRLKHMKVFLQQANQYTLFLIDEFGTGTDPALGGALAESILEELNHRKAIGIITTHYMNLKVLADRTPGIINGSMAFDAHKLEPQFRLEVGKPGSSYTFVVAQRSGLPVSVINRAKKKVRKNSLLLEELLTKMEHEKAEMLKLIQENQKREKRLEELIARQQKSVVQQERREEQDAERIRQKELRLNNQLEDKFRRFVKDWREAKNKKFVLEKYTKQLGERKDVLSQKEQVKLEEQIKHNLKFIRKGAQVRLRNGRVTGIVESVDGQKVSVVFGNVRTVADLSALIYIEPVDKKAVKKSEKKEIPSSEEKGASKKESVAKPQQ